MPWASGVYPGNARLVQYSNSINVIYHIDSLKRQPPKLYANKSDSLCEMDKFLERYDYPNWLKKKQKSKWTLNKLEVKLVIKKNFP